MRLYEHQKQVLEQTERFNRVGYFLDMGLGKTFVGSEKMWDLNTAVNLLICQKSKIDDWVQHFTEHYPDYKVYDLTRKTQSIQFRQLVNSGHIEDDQSVLGVINYELAFRRSYIAHIVSDGELRETQTANYFSNLYPIDCAVPSVNAPSCRKHGTLPENEFLPEI